MKSATLPNKLLYGGRTTKKAELLKSKFLFDSILPQEGLNAVRNEFFKSP